MGWNSACSLTSTKTVPYFTNISRSVFVLDCTNSIIHVQWLRSRSLPLAITDLISVFFRISHLVGHWQTNPCCQLPFPLEQAQRFTVSPVVRYPSDWLHYSSQKPNQHSGADKMAQNEPHREERGQAWRMWSANGAEFCRVGTIRVGKNRMTGAHAWLNYMLPV